MTLRIFTLVHGEPYLGWMEKCLVPSLMWPINRGAIRNAHVHLYTTVESSDRAVEILKRLELPIMVKHQPPEWAGQFLHSALLDCIYDAASDGDAIMIAPPDTIFGEQSVETLLALHKEPKIVIAAAPVRVNDDFLEEFNGEIIHHNAELVTMAWKYLHPTWSEANIALPKTNSFAGGVSWKKIGNKLYSVTHLLPTPFLCDVSPSDAEWFRRYGAPGSFDHIWPSKLVDEGRQRFIGSSDGAFMVEVTPKNQNIPVLYPQDTANPTNYIGSNRHNHINRNTVVIFRGA